MSQSQKPALDDQARAGLSASGPVDRVVRSRARSRSEPEGNRSGRGRRRGDSRGPGSVEARLRDVQSITDAALSRLDDRDLLDELLDRTREVLQADTAAVLLLDFSSGQLIATAAAGLEEEVRQGVRIPVGRGKPARDDIALLMIRRRAQEEDARHK